MINISKRKIIDYEIVERTRDWAAYNAGQTREKLIALKLISDAVDYLCIPQNYTGTGRPSFDMELKLKTAIIKTFCCYSSRRSIPEFLVAKSMGYISKVPHFNSINQFMMSSKMTPHLHQLYKILALPLKDIEVNFAVDSTGFSTFTKKHWTDWRLNYQMQEKKNWKKLHIISGVRSNIITSARITSSNKADTKYFEPLTRQTAENFRMNQISADAAYLSRDNCTIAEELGATPFIMPKKNTALFGQQRYRKARSWINMINFYRDHQDLFLHFYHQRSNVESTFSMMKRKFLPYLRNKTEIAQENELLCKVICHNVSVLCNAMFSLKIDIDFEKNGLKLAKNNKC